MGWFKKDKLSVGELVLLSVQQAHFYMLMEAIMASGTDIQAQIDAFSERLVIASSELADSFTKIRDEIASLKDAASGSKVSLAGLEAAVANAEGKAKEFDGLEPVVAEAPVEPDAPSDEPSEPVAE